MHHGLTLLVLAYRKAGSSLNTERGAATVYAYCTPPSLYNRGCSRKSNRTSRYRLNVVVTDTIPGSSAESYCPAENRFAMLSTTSSPLLGEQFQPNQLCRSERDHAFYYEHRFTYTIDFIRSCLVAIPMKICSG